jgi:hypothetical protein
MSPHQRVLTAAAFTATSRRIRSARAAAAGSGIVVRLHRRGRRPHKPAARISLATRFSRADGRGGEARGVDAWCAVAALGRLVGLADVLGELVVGAPAWRRDVDAVGGVGGPGDLHILMQPPVLPTPR